MHALLFLDGLITVVIVVGTAQCLWWMGKAADDAADFLRKHHWWYFPSLMALTGLLSTGLLTLSLLWAGIAELLCGLLLLALQMRMWKRSLA